jgi:predicted transcriptional regulator
MRTYEFQVTGQDRKNLVAALSEILNISSKYLGAPGFKYQVGELTIDKNGTVTGELEQEVLEALVQRGFVSLIGTSDEDDAPETETVEISEEPSETATADRLTIEYPLAGFSPEKLEILYNLIASKAVLIKKMVGADELPVALTDSTIKFAWFSTDLDGAEIHAYSQFVAALCENAKTKTRVVAQPQAAYENEKFAMRIFGIGLGLKGEEYALCRKLMLQNLTGDSGFRYGKPEDGAPSARRRDGVQREVVSIRLTPDTLEKLSILASQSETEIGQRTSRNMLIEQAIEAYVAAEYANAAPTSETEAPTANEAHQEPHIALETTDISAGKAPADETPTHTAPADKTPNVRDTTEYITEGVA